MADLFLTEKKLKSRIAELKKLIYKDIQPIGNWRVIEDITKEAKYPPIDMSSAKPFHVGDKWTGRDYYLWVQTEAYIPVDSHEIFVFDFGESTGGFNEGFESLLFINGKPYQGVDTFHKEVVIEPCYYGKKVKLSLKLWSGLEGGGEKRERTHEFKQADLVSLDAPTEDLYYLSNMILKTIQELDTSNPIKYTLTNILDKAFKMLDWGRPIRQNFYGSAAICAAWLNEEINKIPKDVNFRVGVIGHTHIDVAWLWRLKHTREKAVRSFSTVLRYMEQYPEYTFLQSQPQIYKYIKEDYPEVYNKIKERIQEGRWEADGAMWLEADCNIPSGESLTRQILHGSKFIKEEFNKEVNYLWLPDVFGYSWALPQILKKSGIDTFMTTKISWNQYNRMPSDTFVWRGLDGSEVMTHFITTPVVGDNNDWAEEWYYTYNGGLDPETVLGIYKGYRNKNINNNLLIAYGLGDGGGGVTKEMLENRRRLDKIPGLPSVKPILAKDYFETLHDTLNQTDQYVHTWDGELYLEYHRGTYTSQAYVKKMNRKTELMLRELEFMYSVYEANNAAEYPSLELYHLWEVLLRNQFHDIIPGTSIEEVYQDHKSEMKKVWLKIDELLGRLSEDSFSYQIMNTTGWERTSLVEMPILEDGNFYDDKGNILPTVRKGKQLVFLMENFKPLSAKSVVFQKEVMEDSVKIGLPIENGIETNHYIILWNDMGHIVRIYDKDFEREVLCGKGNVFQLFEDKPIDYDAWDIDIYYQEKVEELKLDEINITENNKLLAEVEFSCAFKNSKLKQRMILYNHTRRIDFITEVDWGEHQQLLKVKFDVDIRNTQARYDIQYGNVLRPTHWNTSWDMAKFETVAHQWADLSEQGYGVSLLNDCKYGYDIKDKTIRLSLIKSGIHPDPNADMGNHQFTYSLLPHKGDYLDGGVIEEAWEINSNLIPILTKEPIVFPFTMESHQPIVIDACKKAEDGDGWILRIHDQTGGKQRVIFDLQDGHEWRETDLMECNISDYIHSKINIRLKPYEIRSFRIRQSHLLTSK